MNKILIPTDFSEHSNYALEYASFLVKKKGGKLIITHIIRDKKETEIVKDQLKEIEGYIYLKEIDYTFKLVEGNNISKSINKVAVEENVDLIIIGSNGISNVGEMLLGSNTENVIRNSHFNVLTIKHQMTDFNMKSILFPSDFSPETYSVFKTVKEFADLFQATIHLLWVDTSNDIKKSEDMMDKMNMLVEHFHLDSEGIEYKKAIYNDHNEELGIINYAINDNIDIIAIGSHGKSVLHKLLHESTSQNLVRDSFRPILTVRFS